MIAEADTMRELFPEEYEHYSKQVPLFVPRFSPYGTHSSSSYAAQFKRSSWRSGRGFDASLYLRHREYRAAVGFLLVYAMLATKMFL